MAFTEANPRNKGKSLRMVGWTHVNDVLLKLRDGSSVTKGDKPPLPLRKSSRVAPHVLKAGAAGQRRAGAGSGLRA